MKRSAKVLLLAPLLSGCGDRPAAGPPYASATECRAQTKQECQAAPNPAGHGGVVFVPNTYAPVVASRNPMLVARATRGGFGFSARAMSVGAAS